MKAARLTKLTALTKYSLMAAVLSGGLSIACGAQNTTASTPSAAPPTLDSIAAQTNGTPADTAISPQMQAAANRVTKAKSDLDLAHKRLSASKAILKAADAEFKAAKADQQALSLRTQAQTLADSTGMNEPAGMAVTTPGTTATAAPAAPATTPTGDTADKSFDFSGAPNNFSSAPAGAPAYTSGPQPGQ